MRRNERRTLDRQPQLPLVEQLPSVEEPPAATTVDGDWRLDEQTCEVGRAGVAAARAALAASAGRREGYGKAREHPGGALGAAATGDRAA